MTQTFRRSAKVLLKRLMRPHITSSNKKYYLFSGNRILIQHNSGFFSNCSVSLHAIVAFFNAERQLPESIDFSRSFANFKEAGAETSDVYQKYFAPDSGLEIAFCSPIVFPLRSLFDYRKENHRDMNLFVQKYFSPSQEVLEKSKNLQVKYGLNFDNLLTICYRGTDKARETTLGSFDTYLQEAERILAEEPTLDVLVQTDQSQFLAHARERLANVMAFEELPHTESNSVMHNLIDQGKVEWTQTFLGAIFLISRSKYLLLHTGNVARWICLYRGHADGVLQFYHPKEASNGEWLGRI